MRIKKNDVPIEIYTITKAINAEGFVTETYSVPLSETADIQPTGGKFVQADYGINSNPSMVKLMFCDLDTSVQIGQVVQDVVTGINYMIKGLHVWYSHKECILEPYEVTIV